MDALRITYELFRDIWGFGDIGAFLGQLRHASLATAFGALASAYLIVCTIASLSKVTRWLVPHAGIPLHVSALCSLGMWTASVGFHALRSLHAFQLAYALAACTALTYVCARWVPGGAPRASRRQQRHSTERERQRAGASPLHSNDEREEPSAIGDSLRAVRDREEPSGLAQPTPQNRGEASLTERETPHGGASPPRARNQHDAPSGLRDSPRVARERDERSGIGSGSLVAALRSEARGVRALWRLLVRSRYAAINACFAGFALVLVLRSLIVPPLGWDTLTYHGPRAALWVSTQQFTFDRGVGCYDFYRLFFSGGEVFSAWAMLPFHSDLLVNLAGAVQWLGVFFASWAVARALGLREPFAATSAGVVMFLPTVQLEVNSGYVELPLNAALLSGIALSLHCWRRPSTGAALLSALALGVAAAIKPPAIPPALLVGGALAVRLLFTRRLSRRAKLALAAVSGLGALLPVVPFLWQAYLDTGYPLSPLPVRIAGYTLGEASAMIRWYQHRPDLHPYTWPAEKRSLAAVFSSLPQFNESLGSLSVIPLFAFPFGLLALARRQPLIAALLTAAALAPVLAHFGTDLSAVRLTRAPSSTRFLIPFIALIVPIGLVACRPRSWASRCYQLLLLLYPLLTSIVAFRRGVAEWEARYFAGVTIATVVLAVLFAYLAAKRSAALWPSAGLAWVLALTALQVRRDETLPLAYALSAANHGSPRYWAEGVADIDDPAQPHRIAITGGPDHASDKWFHYFFLGRRFQNEVHYVTPTRDGSIAQFGPHGELAAKADQSAWVARLTQAGITHVLTFPPRSLEHSYMDALPSRFQRLHGNREWGLYRVRAPDEGQNTKLTPNNPAFTARDVQAAQRAEGTK